MTTRSWIRKLFARTPRTVRKAPARCRPALEALEDRLAPATFNVTTLADSGAGSLRQAILDANSPAYPGADTITFSVTGTITLGGTQLPAINENLTITGPGAANLTIDANHLSRVLKVAFLVTVDLSGLTLANGHGDDGGGIENLGTLTVSNSTLSANSAASHGGGIHNAGALTVRNSTLSGNHTDGTGGAIMNDPTCTLTVSNSTLSGNSSADSGGGIDNAQGTVTVSNSTLSGNSVPYVGGGIFNDGTLTVNNSIVANSPSGGDIYGSYMGSHNLTGTVALGPLADNGGPTKTHALPAGSPAINAGDNATVPPGLTTDQRGPGFPRIVGGTVDIGAFEFLPTNSPPTITVPPGTQTAYEDVDKALSGISVGDPDGGNLTVTLSVGHGTLTLGTTSGLTVTGNGTGAVTLSGGIANLNAALASLLYRGSLNYSGSDTLNLSASDGSLSATPGSVAIYVKSAAEQAADLQAQVSALQSAGVLNQGQANALNVKLNLQGNVGDIDKVQSFLTQVQDFLSAGILTQAQADVLSYWGNILLLSVTRR
jgi:hypothetical protein